VQHVVSALNGDVVLLNEGRAGVVDHVAHGRLYKDGSIVLTPGDECITQRRRLSFAGIVSIAIALTSKGDFAGDPDVVMSGLPARTKDGRPMDEVVDAAIFETFDNLPRAKRRDADAVSTIIERAVRNSVNVVWGKKPHVHVLVIEL
jgi:ribonuclease J